MSGDNAPEPSKAPPLDPMLAASDELNKRRPAEDAAKMIERDPGSVWKWIYILGPGLISGAANNDPSAIATYSQAGAIYGFSFLWFAPVMVVMMATIVYICAKLSMVGGAGLVGVLRASYSRVILYPVVFSLVIANTIGAGADIGAVCEGIHLLFPSVPANYLLVPVSAALITMLIRASYRLTASVFKWLTLVLFAFVLSGILSRPDPVEVARHTFVPKLEFTAASLAMLVAMLGTSLSPYLYFWQASQRVEEEVSIGRQHLSQRRGATKGELKYAWLDVNVGMFFGGAITYFIILSTALALHRNNVRNVETAADAARALGPVAGSFAEIVFAIGFIGAGLLAIPVLCASAAYAVCEMFNWKYGLEQKLNAAPQFYAVITGTLVCGMLLNFSGIPAMRTLFIAALVNGLLTPFILVMIMLSSNNPAVMGKRVNGVAARVLGWVTTVAAGAGVLSLIVIWLLGFKS